MKSLIENIEIFISGFSIIVFLQVASVLHTSNPDTPQIILSVLNEKAPIILTSSLLETFFLLGFFLISMALLFGLLGIMEVVINTHEHKKLQNHDNRRLES